MNILIDCLTFVRKNGAAEYQRRVISELLKHDTDTRNNLYAVYDSTHGIAYEDLQPEYFERENVKMLDVSGTTLLALVEEYHIDRFYIGCVQVVDEYRGLEDLDCEVVCVVHDLTFEETEREDIDVYLRVQNKSVSSFVNWFLFKKNKGRGKHFISPMINLLKRNPKVTLVAVSEYTKYSLIYSYGIPEERIVTLYSPERVYHDSGKHCSEEMSDLIASGKRFLLILGTQHSLKNTKKAVSAIKQFCAKHKDCYLVTAGKKLEKQFDNHIPMGFLSDEDLNAAYKSCYALVYPTLFEGFGYPPLEVMHYGKPVLASNIGPVREVFQGAPIYFSPLYETDIFQALSSLWSSDYSELSERSRKQYETISIRQKSDLQQLIGMILNC